MTQRTIADRKYYAESTLRAFEYFSLSTSGYNRFRRDFELSNTKTLLCLTSITKSTDDHKFNAIVSSLPGRQKNFNFAQLYSKVAVLFFFKRWIIHIYWQIPF